MLPKPSIPPPSQINQEPTQGVAWTLVGVSLILVCFRVYVRLRSVRQLYLDDVFVILAWVMLLVCATLQQIHTDVLYEIYEIRPTHLPPGFAERYMTFLRYVAPMTILYYNALWHIKFAFLVFFRRLGCNVTGHRIWYWVVFGFTALSWAAAISAIDYKCSFGSQTYILTECPKPYKVRYQRSVFYTNCATDISTDLLIISIPVLMLWRLRIPLRKKILLMGLFSLTILVIVIALVRVTVNNLTLDIAWLFFWSFLEVATAIIVACLASFRQLFVSHNNQTTYNNQQDDTTSRPSQQKRNSGSLMFQSMIQSALHRSFHGYGHRDRSQTQDLGVVQDVMLSSVGSTYEPNSIYVVNDVEISSIRVSSSTLDRNAMHPEFV
ncbi:hypothetical protein BJX99DRAFT_254012 [Aspergillus californicus]